MSTEAREAHAEAPAAAPPARLVTVATPPLQALAPQAALPAAAPASSALLRVQAAAGQIVPQVQYQVARLGVAGQAGLAALTAAVAIAVGALLPAWHAMQGLSANLAQAQHAPSGFSIEQAVPRLAKRERAQHKFV